MAKSKGWLTTFGAAAALVLVGGVLAPATATATPTASPGLVSGTVAGPDGQPAAGATVAMVAWPTPNFLAAQAIGDAVPTMTLATATVTSTGGYSFSPDLSSLGPTYAPANGSVSIEIVASQDGTGQQWSLPVAEHQVPVAAGTTNGTASPRQPAMVDFDMANGIVTSRIGAGPAQTTSVQTVAEPVDDHLSSSEIAPADDTRPGCSGWTYYKNFPKRQEEFLNLYTYDGHATVEEDSGSTHTLGVSLGIPGDGWSAAGSMSLAKTTSSGGTDSFTHNLRLSNYVNDHEYSNLCWDAGGANEHYKYQMRPVSFNSYLTVRKQISPIYWTPSDCVQYSSGTYWKSEGNNQKFSFGLKSPYLSVEAEAAYSQSTKVSWSPGAKGERLCGSDSSGYAHAPYAGAEAPGGSSGCGAASSDTTPRRGQPATIPC